MGDKSLREPEQIIDPTVSNRNRTNESLCTLSPETLPSTQQNHDNRPAISATQALLQLACKRKRLSSSETKHKLSERLSGVGVSSAIHVRTLALEVQKSGADEAVDATGKQKAPNRTSHESARLCHVIADPRHATAISRLYNKIDNRAELDQACNDLWYAEFVDLFNSEDYNPVVTDGKNGVTDDLILRFDPTEHPHKRTGMFLKARWNKMRSKYTVAREKFTKSRQGENDVFDTFTDGDDSLAYMHCVFYGSPALEAIVRALPKGFGVEAGLDEISEARVSADSSERKKRKVSTDTLIADGLAQMAKAVSVLVEVNFNERKENNVSSKFDEFDISDRIAGIVSKLMALEATIRANIRNAVLDSDDEYIEELHSRLVNVQKRIDRALMD